MSAPEEARAAVHGPHPRRARRGELGPGAAGSGRRGGSSAIRAARSLRAPSGAARSCVALFTEMLAAQGADVRRVAHAKRGGRRHRVLSRHLQFAAAHAHGRGPELAALPWREAWDIERSFGPAEPTDRAALSRAVVAAAETGTLFLVSGPDNPTTLNFLPEAHTVLIAASDIVGSYEEAWDRLRAIYGEGALPRTVNLISGPSRTADIEQTIVRGAHGPRRLHVLILG